MQVRVVVRPAVGPSQNKLAKGSYVLYWCQANRRVDNNEALAHAAGLSNRHGLPLLVAESLSFADPQASDRHHTFVLEGIPGMEAALRQRGIGYHFCLRRNATEPEALPALLADAAVVVTDDFPTPWVRQETERLAGRLPIEVHQVDASCIVPMRRMEKKQYAAYTIRPRIHRLLPEYLRPQAEWHVDKPWKGSSPAGHVAVTEANIPELVASCDIDHNVPPSTSFRGSRSHALAHLERFLQERLARYDQERNEPCNHATSTLGPYLHHGRVGALEVALAVRSYAEEHRLIPDAFLEEMIVRRELAYNHAFYAERPDSLEHIPGWAQETLRVHARDERNPCYSYQQFEDAHTYDALWNATQKELRLRGSIHGYYRMYWGKKIIDWSASPEDALRTMLRLHERFALDGGDPNTYTNILWCFGLHDRPWMERPIFGKVRYMALSGMQRKTNVNCYIHEIDQLALNRRDPVRVQ